MNYSGEELYSVQDSAWVPKIPSERIYRVTKHEHQTNVICCLKIKLSVYFKHCYTMALRFYSLLSAEVLL